MKSRWYVIGIDPGLSSGALVLLEGPTERVHAAHALGARPSEDDVLGDRAFTAADALAAKTAGTVAGIVSGMRDELGDELVAIGIESFVDQPSRARANGKTKLVKDRWKTPLAIGHMSAALAGVGYSPAHRNLVYQNASILSQFAAELGELARRPRGSEAEVVCPGDHLLTTSHMHTAWAHAAWLNLRTKEIR